MLFFQDSLPAVSYSVRRKTPIVDYLGRGEECDVVVVVLKGRGLDREFEGLNYLKSMCS